jgi:hypothetical protein
MLFLLIVYIFRSPNFKAEDKINVEFSSNGSRTKAFMALEISQSGKPFILAPIHSVTPMVGGGLSAIFKNANNQEICDAINLTIKPLPIAENYNGKIGNALLTLLEQRMAYLGFDTNLIKGDLANLPSELVPFAI